MVKRQKLEEDDGRFLDKATSAFLDKMREDFAIDRHGLDESWISQVDNYRELSEKLAFEISVRDEAKDALRDLEAEIDGEIRADIEAEQEAAAGNKEVKYKKPTETAIKNMVRDRTEWKAMNTRLRAYTRNVNLIQAMRESYTMRRYALDNMVSLHISGYFGEPKDRKTREHDHEVSKKALNDERKKRRNKED